MDPLPYRHGSGISAVGSDFRWSVSLVCHSLELLRIPSFSPIQSVSGKRREIERGRKIRVLGVLKMYSTSYMRKSFKDSLKLLEADIQHANTLWAPRRVIPKPLSLPFLPPPLFFNLLISDHCFSISALHTLVWLFSLFTRMGFYFFSLQFRPSIGILFIYLSSSFKDWIFFLILDSTIMMIDDPTELSVLWSGHPIFHENTMVLVFRWECHIAVQRSCFFFLFSGLTAVLPELLDF